MKFITKFRDEIYHKILFVTLSFISALFCQAQQHADTLVFHRNNRGMISFLALNRMATKRMQITSPFLSGYYMQKMMMDFD